MQFSTPIAFSPIDQILDLARAAEDTGFARITLDPPPLTQVPFYAGVTDVIVIPWLIEGHGYDAPPEVKRESLARFGEKYITA